MASSSPNRLGSPAKQPYREARRSRSSRGDESADSPSRQLHREFSQLYLDSDRSFLARLDEAAEERAKEHVEALEYSKAQHERVRQNADIARLRFELEHEKERQKREDDERRALERERRELAEQEIAERQRQREALERIEAERQRAAEEAKAVAEAEARLRVQQERQAAEKARREADQAESDRKAREAAEAAERTSREEKPRVVPPPTTTAMTAVSQSAPSQPQLAGASSWASDVSHLVSPLAQKEAIHQQYLELHKRLKDFRRWMKGLRAQYPTLKEKMGPHRREMKNQISKLTRVRGANTKPLSAIRAIFQDALSYREGPTIDARLYFVTPLPVASEAEAQVSALLLFLMNSFAKLIFAQFIDEGGTGREVDHVGLCAGQIFAQNEHRFHGVPFTDLLLCKFHVFCPVLFGIYGDPKTDAGKRRIGWRWDSDEGQWVDTKKHSERMTGLGAGFASISLRDFSKAKNFKTFYPNSNYWRALSNIVNTPPRDVTDTHYLVLKSLTERFAAKFIQFYGHAAIVALRKALLEFPKHKKSVASDALGTVVEAIKRDFHITL